MFCRDARVSPLMARRLGSSVATRRMLHRPQTRTMHGSRRGLVLLSLGQQHASKSTQMWCDLAPWLSPHNKDCVCTLHLTVLSCATGYVSASQSKVLKHCPITATVVCLELCFDVWAHFVVSTKQCLSLLMCLLKQDAGVDGCGVAEGSCRVPVPFHKTKFPKGYWPMIVKSKPKSLVESW
jgi:hypothetical protein